MPETFSRSGVVLNADGEPVPRAFITIKQASVRMPDLAVMTDDNGRFEMRLPMGTFTLRAHHSGRQGEISFSNPDATAIKIVVNDESETDFPSGRSR